MANYDLGTAERGEAEAKMETEKQPKDPATSRTISMDEFTEVMTILHGLTKKCYQQLSSEADLDDSKGQCASPGDDFAASSTILDAQLAKYDPHPNAADYGIDVSLRSFNNAVEGHVLVLRNLKLIGQKMARGEQIDKAALALLCCYRGMLVVLFRV
ncbi:hypothetical protein SCUCBS95973_003389 [Sporothrix curviconia]|uniref:Uncharacterized protein n=1 Tax=Sporothrix curviconia TaxID=1260050 RepID=A0ABP0BEW6_9PEZI